MPEIADFDGAARPCQPTSATPGSPQKVLVFMARALAGQELFHDDDARPTLRSRRPGVIGSRGCRVVKPKTSQYVGVYCRGPGRWTAQLKSNGTVKYLGTYTTERAARAAYVKHKRALAA